MMNSADPEVEHYDKTSNPVYLTFLFNLFRVAIGLMTSFYALSPMFDHYGIGFNPNEILVGQQ